MPANSPLQLIVFDCDGTLVDSQHTIVAAMTGAWRAAGRAEGPAPEDVRRVVGLPLLEAITRLLPEADADEHEQLVEGYKTTFHAQRTESGFQEQLYPGVHEVLETLAAIGMVLGIATGKGRGSLDITLEHHGIKERFVTLQTSDIAPGKPNPEMLYRAMRETGAEPQNTAMIGDTSFDMLMARNAGVAAIGVAWGYHEPAELADSGAHMVIESFSDLPTALTRAGLSISG